MNITFFVWHIYLYMKTTMKHPPFISSHLGIYAKHSWMRHGKPSATTTHHDVCTFFVEIWRPLQPQGRTSFTEHTQVELELVARFFVGRKNIRGNFAAGGVTRSGPPLVVNMELLTPRVITRVTHLEGHFTPSCRCGCGWFRMILISGFVG